MLHEIALVVQQTPADSLATAVGSAVGNFIALKLALLLGLVVKGVTSGVNSVSSKLLSKVPTQYQGFVKAGVAYVFAQLAVFASPLLAHIGLPALPSDVGQFTTYLAGASITLVAMGVHDVYGRYIAPLLAKLGIGGTTTPPTPPAAPAIVATAGTLSAK